MKQSFILNLPTFILAASFAILPARLDAQDEASAAGFSDRAAIEKRLEAARAELAELPGNANPELRERLEQWQAGCQYHLAAVDYLAAARQGLAKAGQESSAWNGFSQPPPHSVLLLDEIRESLASLGISQRTVEAQLRIFKAEVEGFRAKLAGHQQAERRFIEAAEKAADAEARQGARQSAKVENLTACVTAERIGRRQLRIATEQADLDAIVVKKELAARQLKAVEGKPVFSREELDKLQQQIAREHDEIAQTLVDESKPGQATNPLLTWKLEFLDLKKLFWDTRFAALNSRNPAELRAAVDTLKGLQGRVDDWIEISELRLDGGDVETAHADPALLRDAVLQLREMQRRIGFAISDLRHMIDKAFAEAGVTISFPQRDIHFDTDASLRVELSRAPKPASETRAHPLP